MNEWFKKLPETIKEKWGKWTVVQKGILAGIVIAVVLAIVLLATFSSKPTTVYLFNSAITDEVARDKIITRLDEENVKVYVSADGHISVENETIAKRWRSRLIAEDLVPKGSSVYDILNISKWTRNDFDDNAKWKQLMETQLKEHLKQLAGVDNANVIITIPEETLFASNQNKPTASVIIFPSSGSDILNSKNSVKAIQRLIMYSIEGLTEENVTISNGTTGEEVNDFAGMEESDRLSNIQKEQKIIRRWETEYSAAIINQLTKIYGEDRVSVANVKVEMDMSKQSSSKTEYTGVTIKADNPDTPYDDSQIVEGLTISEETVNKSQTGTGYNPEGPAGVEGQNPPVYSDMSNMISKTTEEGVKRNYALNREDSTVEKSPTVGKVTVAVNIDGTWKKLYNEKGNLIIENGGIKREYTPLTEEQKADAIELVKGSIGFNNKRGDIVAVTNTAIDRTAQFEAEDLAFIKSQQTKRTIIYSLFGILGVLIVFIAFRFISREIERRKRLREEELLRKQQAEREQALWDAKQDGMEVTMSVEERRRAELQENAIAMAKEHPEDVAMLIRTWLREEA